MNVLKWFGLAWSPVSSELCCSAEFGASHWSISTSSREISTLTKALKKQKRKKNVRPSLISRTAEREAVPTFSETLNLKKDQSLTIFTLLRPKRSESSVKLWTSANSNPAVECSSNSFVNQSSFQSIWILVIDYFYCSGLPSFPFPYFLSPCADFYKRLNICAYFARQWLFFMFSLKFYAGNCRTAGQNWSLCACLTLDRCIR